MSKRAVSVKCTIASECQGLSLWVYRLDGWLTCRHMQYALAWKRAPMNMELSLISVSAPVQRVLLFKSPCKPCNIVLQTVGSWGDFVLKVLQIEAGTGTALYLYVACKTASF